MTSGMMFTQQERKNRFMETNVVLTEEMLENSRSIGDIIYALYNAGIKKFTVEVDPGGK